MNHLKEKYRPNSDIPRASHSDACTDSSQPIDDSDVYIPRHAIRRESRHASRADVQTIIYTITSAASSDHYEQTKNEKSTRPHSTYLEQKYHP